MFIHVYIFSPVAMGQKKAPPQNSRVFLRFFLVPILPYRVFCWGTSPVFCPQPSSQALRPQISWSWWSSLMRSVRSTTSTPGLPETRRLWPLWCCPLDRDFLDLVAFLEGTRRDGAWWPYKLYSCFLIFLIGHWVPCARKLVLDSWIVLAYVDHFELCFFCPFACALFYQRDSRFIIYKSKNGMFATVRCATRLPGWNLDYRYNLAKEKQRGRQRQISSFPCTKRVNDLTIWMH